MLASPDAVFVAKFIGMIGFLMTVYPPLRAGFKHFKLLQYTKSDPAETDVGKILKERITNFLSKAAGEFRAWDFYLMAGGVLLTFLASLHDFWVASQNI